MEFVNQKLRLLEDGGRNNSQQRDTHIEAKVAYGNIHFISSEFKMLSPSILSISKQKEIEDKVEFSSHGAKSGIWHIPHKSAYF